MYMLELSVVASAAINLPFNSSWGSFAFDRASAGAAGGGVLFGLFDFAPGFSDFDLAAVARLGRDLDLFAERRVLGDCPDSPGGDVGWESLAVLFNRLN